MRRRRFLMLAGAGAGLAVLAPASEIVRLAGGFAGRPGPWVLTSPPSGGWTLVNQPHAVYHDGRTYFGYVRGDTGSICIRAYDHATGSVGPETVMHANMAVDTHVGPSLHVREADHRIMAFYSGHGAKGALFQWVSDGPGSIASGTVTNLHPQVHAKEYTYPAITEVSGRLMLFFRSHGAFRRGHLNARWSYTVSKDGGSTWIRARDFWAMPGRGVYVYARSTRPDRVDLALLDGNPRADPGVAACHLFTDGSRFYRTDGTRVRRDRPWGRSDATHVFVPGAGRSAGGASAALTVDGQPCMGFPVLGPNRTHWARWDGGSWIDHDVGPGTDRPELVPQDAERFYLAQPVNELYGVAHYRTSDQGASWSREWVMPPGENESRRVSVPQNRDPSLGVLWLYGPELSDRDFQLGIAGASAER